LLECLDFFKVEFYGGTDEQGKDILCWEYDRFDDLKLINRTLSGPQGLARSPC